ncbi:hypothetical protein VKT23_014053 [Stygiomarasmius scandens]|uniref:NADH dehydrogenase subunit 6 n=1 Tax=Marasmiellus scandens TaxID=2682957 RepID=A0ABR1J4H7_9AGAR
MFKKLLLFVLSSLALVGAVSVVQGRVTLQDLEEVGLVSLALLQKLFDLCYDGSSLGIHTLLTYFGFSLALGFLIGFVFGWLAFMILLGWQILEAEAVMNLSVNQ